MIKRHFDTPHFLFPQPRRPHRLPGFLFHPADKRRYSLPPRVACTVLPAFLPALSVAKAYPSTSVLRKSDMPSNHFLHAK